MSGKRLPLGLCCRNCWDFHRYKRSSRWASRVLCEVAVEPAGYSAKCSLPPGRPSTKVIIKKAMLASAYSADRQAREPVIECSKMPMIQHPAAGSRPSGQGSAGRSSPVPGLLHPCYSLPSCLGHCVCCRYLAVRARVPVKHAALPQAGHATSRSASERSCVQPASLMQHPLYVTPNSKRNMMLAGRGRRAAEQGGTVWQSKVGLCLIAAGAACWQPCHAQLWTG